MKLRTRAITHVLKWLFSSAVRWPSLGLGEEGVQELGTEGMGAS